MFGTLVINRKVLEKSKSNDYKKCYCGLCKALQYKHGNLSRITLNYDMTFLILILNEIYHEETIEKQEGCFSHRGKKISYLDNKNIDYVSDMNIIVSYYSMLDNWNDDKKISAFLYAKILKKDFKKICERYPEKSNNIKIYMNKLSEYEKKKILDPDGTANICGEIFSELFAPYNDKNMEKLKRLGKNIGKYTYMLDAFVDYEEDIKKNRYNPLKETEKEMVEKILHLIMADVLESYEALGINNDIINNILKLGIWTKYYIYKRNKIKKNSKINMDRI